MECPLEDNSYSCHCFLSAVKGRTGMNPLKILKSYTHLRPRYSKNNVRILNPCRSIFLWQWKVDEVKPGNLAKRTLRIHLCLEYLKLLFLVYCMYANARTISERSTKRPYKKREHSVNNIRTFRKEMKKKNQIQENWVEGWVRSLQVCVP